jgi:glycerophosphoryl diester phosphodiesterase
MAEGKWKMARALTAPLRWGASKVRGRKRRTRLAEAAGQKRPLVIGHRGFSGIAPENTLASFELALEAEVDLVELDYRQSADGQLVVIHDSDLDRTTNARLHWGNKHIRVDGKTSWEIRGLDAGSWFDPRYSSERIPLLSEALELIQSRGVALLERKSGDVEATAQALEKHGMVGRVVVQSFDWGFLKALHARLPRQTLAALGPLSGLPGVKKAPGVFGQLSGRWLKALRKTGANVVVWNKQVSRVAVRRAHEEGLKVWIYTVDRAELANYLLDLGVDGLITNNPARMWKVIAERNF